MVILHLKTRPINQLPARLKIVIQAELWYHRGLISSDMETEAPSTECRHSNYYILCMIEAHLLSIVSQLNRVVLTDLFVKYFTHKMNLY